MNQENNEKIEKFLKAFSAKPAPTVLKEKILSGARKRQNSYAMMISFYWKGLGGCLLLLIFIIAIDAVTTHAQIKRFSSFVDQKQESIVLTDEERMLIKDIIGEFSSPTKTDTTMNLYRFLEKKTKKRRQTEWRESLKKEFEQDENT